MNPVVIYVGKEARAVIHCDDNTYAKQEISFIVKALKSDKDNKGRHIKWVEKK